ncbi:MAG TPA: HEAT repeat domain-containing protein [Pyrinomonadaceae bacterium]|nr:HEAT repeat domain-containing protein [Pyrinomonadaceae bacterium]
MSKPLAVFTFALMLLPPNAACAQGSMHVDAASQGVARQQQSALQTPKFTPVEGADLKSKMDDAARRAKAAGQAVFWTAYTFDVRPGVAVDPGGIEFHGSMQTMGDTSVFIGTSNGVAVETPDLAVFVLREPSRGGDAVTRMEVYNLRRVREYSGYPVYWAGRAGNEESLNYLRAFAESSQKRELQERATLAIAIHDDARVRQLLKGFVGSSRNTQVRSTAVFWLGMSGGETPYLAGIVRDDKEDKDLRETAAHAIGASRDREALDTLQSLYATLKVGDVRKAIIHAVADNENREAAYSFLLKIARSDPEGDARGQAVHRIGDGWGEAAIDELMKIYASDRNEDVRQQVIHALADISGARAEGKLLEIARGDSNSDMRKQAIHRLGERGTESSFAELMKLFETERDPEVKGQILHSFSEMKDPRAESRLLAAARDRSEHPEVRQQAIHWLGEREGDSSIDELMKIFQGEPSKEVREQIIHALSEMNSRRAEEKLFEIARSADNEELRQSAIHRLGELVSERSFQMLGETVNSSGEKTEVQLEAVRAISERPAEQAVPMLIKVARTHPNAEVRKEAIRKLGESGDQRAVEFFREILPK